jgi:2-oxoisovalerate dehydrogenase E2 component (dihydrolipoyl transacylase)
MSTFALPDLGEGLVEAEIVSWHVGEGDHVVVDQPLLAVETEKAVVEIPSPKAGHISKLLAKIGERVKVGAPVVEFEEGPHAESVTVMGQLAGATAAKPTPHADTTTTPAHPVSSAPGVRASPAVRARARELAVDLSAIAPTGPDNTITLADIQGASSSSATEPGAEALRGARRVMATNMARAWREVVHATVQDDAVVQAWSTTEDVSGRLVRALIAGCKAEPALNAGFDGATLSLRANQTIDLGIAIDSPQGLFAPVLRDVARGTPQDWRSQIEAFKQRVQDRSLAPADMRGATITLSNFGSIAGRHASLIVMPPQVAILGVGRMMMQPVQATEGVALRLVLPLSLTFDHRAITGGMATRFLRAVIGDLEAAA